ncbi:hypothetical protein RRG08_004541 [Elysia crispata]|uniref:Uncharacterized protein n=1 Tax=Elysia crispata TaxID=231223 RepID=A0AAE1B9H3_9GAST|nr:hypothetical protein RRG08_004541 [Elysia crispata]
MYNLYLFLLQPLREIGVLHSALLFDAQILVAKAKLKSPRCSKDITSHRLLTSKELMNEKKAATQKKKNEEAPNQEGKEKKLQKKLETAN